MTFKNSESRKPNLVNCTHIIEICVINIPTIKLLVLHKIHEKIGNERGSPIIVYDDVKFVKL